MKKVLSLILALVMCLSLCACGGGETAESPYEKYAKYEELFMYLESNDYDNANAYVQNFFGKTEDANKAEQNESTPTDTEPEETEPTYTTIEITLDNWQEYFEIKMVVVESRNDFDELDCFYPNMTMYLKEEWANIATDMEVAVEYLCTDGYYCNYSYNLETGEVIEGEKNTEAWHSSEEGDTFTLKKSAITSGKRLFGGVHSDTFVLDGNIATIEGSMYSNVEIVRIHGTITIEE